MDQRIQLLREGLGERVESVKANALLMLQIWLKESCNNDVTMLLKLINVEEHSGKIVSDKILEPSVCHL